ncbi:dihydrofolate reductase family protein [Prauserella flavalba]|uniref:Deaminase n=1 Tax=Prauserella flavalba TaxID=1477506 RepID=A0A318LQD7_9PSEU|nr:dihydrofolate reductase family protein [Prauserella flavalba]PXY35760.1 deaminase [Prauserella flavalba]
MTDTAGRRVIAWASISIDGYTSGPEGPAHDTWLYRHAGRQETAEYFEGVWRGVDTALLGRTNYEGFASVWPAITRDPATDARTRELGRWLEAVEKVVFSRTLESAGWRNSRVAREPEREVAALKASDGGAIMVLNSASVIQTLLKADLIDDLRFAVVPALLGGGLRLLPEGLPASGWTLASSATLAHGAVCLHYRRG